MSIPDGGSTDVRVVDELTDHQLDDLVGLYRSTWWASDRTVDDARAVVGASDLVVGLIEVASDRLVAFCRVLTDRHVIAVILDVIVHPDRRGAGLGGRLMDEILGRPELARVGSIELVCQPDLLDFYRRFGFTDQVGSSLLMRLTIDPRLSG
jgi:ribosomal protein S18 acetylase RimI-like enzyme